MNWSQFLSAAGVIASMGLLHVLCRRVQRRVFQAVHTTLAVDRWIVYGLLATGMVISGFLVLGFFGLLTGIHLIHSQTLAGLLLLCWALERVWPTRKGTEERSQEDQKGLGMTDPRFWSFLPTGRMERWSVALAAMVFVVFVLEAGTRPPAGWDGLVYHLPLAAMWLKSHSLAFLPESWKFNMPGNGELILLFFMYLGEERIVSLAFFPFAVLGMLIVFAFSQRLAGSSSGSTFAALGFGTMPLVLYNTFYAYVDLFGAIFFLCAMYLVLWWYQEQRVEQSSSLYFPALVGLAFGIAMGSKYTYVPFLLLIMVLGFGLALVRKHSDLTSVVRRLQQGARQAITILIWACVPSVFWYVRNFVSAGNAVFPVKIGFGGITREEGRVERWEWARGVPYKDPDCGFLGKDLMAWVGALWTDCHPTGWHFSQNWGFGPIFGTFIPVFILLVIGWVLVQVIREGQVHSVLLPLGVSGLFLWYWWVILPTNQMRLILPVIPLLFTVVGCGIGLLSSRARQGIGVLFLCVMMVNTTLVVAHPLKELGSRVYRQTWNRNVYFGIPTVLEQLPPGSTILNASHETWNYGLFGKNLQYQVVTTRALIEPTRVQEISSELVNRWHLDYIFYDTRQKLILKDNVKAEVIYQEEMEGFRGPYQHILYKLEETKGSND